MTSLTTRGRVAVVAGLVASGVLCAGAAVALVRATDRTPAPTTLPKVHATLLLPTGTPTPTAAASATPSPTAAPAASPTASARATATPARTSTPAPTRTTARRPAHQPTVVPAPAGPAVDASVDPVNGQPGAVVLSVHATTDAGPLTLTSVRWGDGSTVTTPDGTACGDGCEDWSLPHTYSKAGSYDIVVTVKDATDSTTVVLHLTVSSVGG